LQQSAGRVQRRVTVRLTVVVCDSAPKVPVMVMVRVPVVAVLLTVNVKVLVVAVGFGVKLAVTPVGRPEALRVTLPLNPATGLTVIVLDPLWLRAMLRLLGDAERLKFGAAFTVRLIVAVCINPPEVPVIVTVKVPVVALLLAVSVSVLVVVAGFGLKPAVTPLGWPEAERLTLPPKPFTGVTETVLVPPAPPCVMVTGEVAERPKLGP